MNALIVHGLHATSVQISWTLVAFIIAQFSTRLERR